MKKNNNKSNSKRSAKREVIDLSKDPVVIKKAEKAMQTIERYGLDKKFGEIRKKLTEQRQNPA